jgi:hypothetical protein
MLYLLRIVLVVLLIVLLFRAIFGSPSVRQQDTHDIKHDDRDDNGRKVSKQTGDYIEYEEIKEE